MESSRGDVDSIRLHPQNVILSISFTVSKKSVILSTGGFWEESWALLTILDHLELSYTDVKILSKKLGETFSGLSGGPRGVFRPKMGCQNGAKTAPNKLQTRSRIQHSSPSDFRPIREPFRTPSWRHKSGQNPDRGVKKPHFQHDAFIRFQKLCNREKRASYRA